MSRPGHVKKAAKAAEETVAAEEEREAELTGTWLDGIAVGWERSVAWLLTKSTQAWADDDEKRARELKNLAAEMKKEAEEARKLREAHRRDHS